jgi:hypothetical protein
VQEGQRRLTVHADDHACEFGLGHLALDDAGIGREAFAPDKAFAHATPQYALEHMTEGVALTQAPVAVLGEGRVIGHRSVQVETTQPAIRQVQMDLTQQVRGT